MGNIYIERKSQCSKSDTLKSFLLFLWHPTSSTFLIPLLLAAGNLDFSLRDCPQATGATKVPRSLFPLGDCYQYTVWKELWIPSCLHWVWDNLEAWFKLKSFPTESGQAPLVVGLWNPCVAFSSSCLALRNSLSGFPLRHFLNHLQDFLINPHLGPAPWEPDLRNLPLTWSWVRMELCHYCPGDTTFTAD